MLHSNEGLIYFTYAGNVAFTFILHLKLCFGTEELHGIPSKTMGKLPEPSYRDVLHNDAQ